MKHPITPNRQINIPYLMKIGNGKIRKIGRYLFDKDMLKTAVFWGEGIAQMLGKDFYAGIKEYKIELVRDEAVNTIALEDITQTAFSLPPDTNAIIGIGGGKALDFAKYVAYLLRLPFISVPTSTSNDGFCSPSASLTVAGARKSVKSSIPYGVVIDLDVIHSCPISFIYSGIGDMFSKVSALWDWKQANLKTQEKYNDFAVMLSYNSLDLLYIGHSKDITTSQFQRSLVNSLLYSGIAMEIAGTSRPASGSEHLISHALDSISEHPQLHGLQVGVASYLCAILQNNTATDALRKVLKEIGFFDFVAKNPFKKEEFFKALEEAPNIKQNYYTILSEPDSLSRAKEIITTDKILKKLII